MDLKKIIAEVLYENDIPSLESDQGLLFVTVFSRTPFRQITIDDTKFHIGEIEFDVHDPDCFEKMIKRIKFVIAADQLHLSVTE